ncbi:hypothetical protein B7P34_08470 [Streptosporangium nondiastaticum]|uniref:Insertion element IS402-like domain-containing protein n=1 Tax=Streptosporangium nondiastaticum TaxID=35764 RepID=A0A9X7PIG1_9ACTN|nr:hypothetical protein B7P34_08470 [Streptosporangium nondiastaticum]
MAAQSPEPGGAPEAVCGGLRRMPPRTFRHLGLVRPIMWLLRIRVVDVDMGRGDLSDAEWERLQPFLPVSNRRCGRWRDHRQVIDGILHRVRTGVQWRDLPERFGPWKTVYECHRLWSVDGTWERLLQQVQAEADAAGEIDWDISVDSTIVRAHQHAAGARTDPPPAPAWWRWCER